MKIGIPCLMLKGGDGYAKGKHAGNARAVACEALEERWGSDDDLDRTRSNLNTYEVQSGWEGLGFESGKTLSDWWEESASNFRRKVHCKDKDGNEVIRERRLGENTSIGFAAILKPDGNYLATLDEDEQERFLSDLKACALDVFAARGLEVQVVATHRDEMSKHLHFLGYDPAYQLGRKITLPFFTELNKEIPERMRQLGWSDVENAIAYDAEKVEAEITEATKGMTEEEASDYRQQYMSDLIDEKKRKKKTHGRSSKQYKADMDAEKLERKAAQLEQAAASLEDAARDVEAANHDKQTAQREAASIRAFAREEMQRMHDDIEQYAAAKSEELTQREDAVSENEIEIKRRRKQTDAALQHAKREQAEAEQHNRTAAERVSRSSALDGKPVGVIVDFAVSALMRWLRRRNVRLADELANELDDKSYKNSILVGMLDSDIGGGFGTAENVNYPEQHVYNFE